MIKHSILNDSKAVKYNSIIIVDGYDRETERVIKLKKPNTTIVNSTMITDFISAIRLNTEKKELQLQAKLSDVSNSLDKRLTEQAKILRVLDTFLSKEFRKKRSK